MSAKETTALTAGRLQKVRAVFEAASERDGSGRNAFLDQECQGDPELRSAVERMLDFSIQEHVILDHPLTLQAEKLLSNPEILKEGTKVGNYQIVREIGVGGMGSVYLAKSISSDNQELYAIKVVRSWSYDVSRRFQQEQTILKSLQHPNIARLVDNGTTEDNNPYFVMEFVEGVILDKYCDAHGLSIKDRITLFRQLCAAMRYLHQNLVVHRDLKPSNILVKTDGTVKLVDFGIAKLLQLSDGPLSPLNATIGLMTPDYASPEQICGGPLSTLTDVYSLGVVLYELLSGAKPFTAHDGALHETIRRICEEEPKKPSAAMVRGGVGHRYELRGELDNIVLKAIRKEPERRYASVEQLDEDLRRYLEGLPVLAQGDSLQYRVSKFLKRYKTAVAISCLAVFSLVGGIVATSIEARIAQTERRRAEVHAREAEEAKALAENQTKIAEQERLRAEHAAKEAQIQKSNAERRLGELQQLAKGAAQVYSATHERLGSLDANVIAQNTHESLEVLQKEIPLRPDYVQMFQNTMPSKNPDSSWHVPKGWYANEEAPGEYFVGTDHKIVHHGKSSLFVHSLVPNPKSFLYVFENFDAKSFRGKRVELSGYLRSKDLYETTLFLVTRGNQLNGSSDGFKLMGTTQWKKYRIVMDIPADADVVTISFAMHGKGTFWADQFDFHEVDSHTPLTLQNWATKFGFY